jgi:hypothetical protein
MTSKTHISNYPPFGVYLQNRNFTGEKYRYGYNTQEKVDEVAGSGNHYTAQFWEYDPRAVHRWNLDPKPNPSFSPYAINQCNPILYSDPDGDTVKYSGFRDKVNAFFGRAFNKDFREKFKAWDESPDTYTLQKSKDFGKNKLVDAKPCEFSCDNGIAQNMVYYNKGFTTNDISNPILRSAAIPFDLAFNIGKLPIAAISGLGIGIHNIFSKNDIGWGWGNRIEFHNGANFLSWGFGNFNKYNMFGQNLSDNPFGSKKIYPEDGLIGLRVGIGMKRTPNFIDVLGQVYDRQGQSYHFHINLAKERVRNRKLGGESVIDLKE